MTNKTKTVAASVNDRALLTNLKHMFASGYSILGELLQNSRRAGATLITIEHHTETNRLLVHDNGSGIEDFSKIVTLCESGWSDDVKIHDNPFGMGVFSLFYACESVEYQSKGLTLKVDLDDIINKRQVDLQPSETSVVGTVVVLNKLAPEIKDPMKMAKMVKFYARGFTVPVVFNGVVVPRDHAKNTRQDFERFGAAEFAFSSWKQGSAIPTKSYRNFTSKFRCYLLGLPIEGGADEGVNSDAIVHLDSAVFMPQMPDRAHLYNGSEQRSVIEKTFKDWIAHKLAQIKAKMPVKDFVKVHWCDCMSFAPTLLCDIPYVPKSVFSTVDVLHNDDNEMFGVPENQEGLYSANDFSCGAVHAWLGAELYAQEEHAGAIARIMQREGILHVLRSDLPNGHWLCREIPDASEFVASVTAQGEKGRASIGWSDSIAAVLVDSIHVEITSQVDNQLKLVYDITDSWVLVGSNGSFACYIVSGDASPDHPLTYVESFEDEYDTFQEEWRDKAVSAADRAISMLKGASFHSLIDGQIREIDVPVTELHLGSMVLVGVNELYTDWHENYHVGKDCVDLDQAVWEEMAASLGSTPEAVKHAFVKASKIKLINGGPRDPEWAIARQAEEARILVLSQSEQGANHVA